VQPIFNRDIYYNRKINEDFTHIRATDVDKYRRELIAEIKLAYYNYLQSLELEKILASGMNVLLENLRVNESLLANDKVTRDVVYQAEAELAGLREDMASAEMMKYSSEAWFNFLLNRDLQDEIIAGDTSIILPIPEIQAAGSKALQEREDLQMLDQYLSLAQNNLNLDKSSRLPNLMAVVDYGYQGAEYSFTADDDFVMASVLLTWDIFKGFQNNRRISQAQLQREVILKKREETEKLISLEVINAWYDLATAAKKISASEDRAKATREAFRMIDKRYAQGQTGMLEYTSARRNMTEAETKLIIARYSYLSKYAEFERAAGLVNLGEFE
jgi:outer membrane protein TolC